MHLDSAACGKRLPSGERGAGPGRACVHRDARKRGERGGANDRESGVWSHGGLSYAEVGLPAEAQRAFGPVATSLATKTRNREEDPGWWYQMECMLRGVVAFLRGSPARCLSAFSGARIVAHSRSGANLYEPAFSFAIFSSAARRRPALN